MKKGIVFILFGIFFFYGCKTTPGALDEENIVNITSEYLILDCFVAKPYSLVNMDTLLIFYDRYDGKMFSIYDIKNDRCLGRVVSEGHGAGEVTAPVDILSFPQQGLFYFTERHTGNLNLFDIQEGGIQEKIHFESHATNLQKMGNYFVGLGYYDNGCLGIYDQKGRLIRTDGIYPFRGERMERLAASLIYQAVLCASPNSDFFATGNVLCDHLAFYRVTENEALLLRQYQSVDAKAKFVGSKYGGSLRVDEDCIINYTWAYGTDNYCYMLYSGKKYKENENMDWGNFIRVFDWNGNYIKTYKTDRDILTFCVDKVDQCIYAVAEDDSTGGYSIVKMKI